MKRKIALLALLAAFPPLSTDMYLAAMPLLVTAWEQPLTTVNLTLVGFFISYCCFLLIYGPLSDRFGRKPPLLLGLAFYVTACLACSLSGNIYQLIVARVVQGMGAASASAISFAICKDLFEGHLRQRIFLQLGIIIAAAPMVAPILGGWIIESFSWRWIFALQALLGTIAAMGVVSLREPLAELNTEKLRRVLQSYARLFKNKQYSLLALIFAILGVPIFAFIAVSSDVYIQMWGYSEQEFGYLFCFNASAFMIGPFVFSRIVRTYPLSRLLPIGNLGMVCSSIPLLITQIPQPWRLAIPMWFMTFFFAFGRPPGNNLILEQVERDVGSASSFMVFIFFVTGSISMWIISLGWEDTIKVIGVMGVVFPAITLISWFGINKTLKLKFP
jgi:MFS transporter, DHA1 family, multidrug resistance protein